MQLMFVSPAKSLVLLVHQHMVAMESTQQHVYYMFLSPISGVLRYPVDLEEINYLHSQLG